MERTCIVLINVRFLNSRTFAPTSHLPRRTHCAFHLVSPGPGPVISQSISQVLPSRSTFTHSSDPHLGPLLSSVTSKGALPVPTPRLLDLPSGLPLGSWSTSPISEMPGAICCPEGVGGDPLSVPVKRQRYDAHFSHWQLVTRETLALFKEDIPLPETPATHPRLEPRRSGEPDHNPEEGYEEAPTSDQEPAVARPMSLLLRHKSLSFLGQGLRRQSR